MPQVRSAVRRVLVVVLGAALALTAVAPAGAATAGTAPSGTGTLRLSLASPVDGPTVVTLTGPATFAHSTDAGGISAKTFVAPVGSYAVSTPDVVIKGLVYRATLAQRTASVQRGRSTAVTVTYLPAPMATDLRVTALGGTGVTLAWSAPPASARGRTPVAYSLRRTAAEAPPLTRPSEGTPVVVAGSTATDTGLSAGGRYRYSLFTQTQYGWNGPVELQLGTTPPADSTDAAYALASGARILTAAQAAGAVPIGDGVLLTPGLGVLALSVGTPVVLPVTPLLAGGYVGQVRAISGDGKQVEVGPASLDQVFDLYALSVPDFGEPPQELTQAEHGEPVPPQSFTAAKAESDERVPLDEAGPSAKAFAAPGGVDCSGSLPTFQFTPIVGLGGHFGYVLDKKNVLGLDVPTGGSFDVGVNVTASGAMNIKIGAGVKCPTSYKKLTRQLSFNPVPMGLAFDVDSLVEATTATEATGVGVATTVGMSIKGGLGSSGSTLEGKVTAVGTPVEPKVTKSGSLAVKLGGELLIGPGIFTDGAGVAVGISGSLYPMDIKAERAYPYPDGESCLKLSAGFTREVAVTGKAWFKGWSLTEQLVIPGLSGTTDYVGPLTLPKGCSASGPPTPPTQVGDDLLGAGTTKVGDSVTGSWGKVPGFVPGSSTWVLSTGAIAHALGPPSKFADTQLGAPGDALLTTLAGRQTYDASAYQVTLVPKGKTLHVKYVFASEEYPEYVGSAYNDVMAVAVDGKACSLVPGTSLPVAINNVNASRNAGYYIDNSQGAAGYGTSMDGLTKPLTCTVPVTPGRPVTVRISVADTADRRYDSAVALVDGGIWLSGGARSGRPWPDLAPPADRRAPIGRRPEA